MSNPNRRHPVVDDAPPPPYSETDLYSNSAGPLSSRNGVAAYGTTNNGDDAASRVSSSTGEIVYTPPLTPHSPNSQPNHPSSQQQLPPQLQQQTSAEDDSGISSPASFYFQSRPPPATSPNLNSAVYTIDLRDESRPDDIPYQPNWAARDITDQDWATFINFLIPDHATRGNAAVAERKLRAEAMSEAGETENSTGTMRSHTEAQLEPLQDGDKESLGKAERMKDSEQTIRQWNQHFFMPRGVTVRLSHQAGRQPMPGSWEPGFDGPQDASRAVADPSSRQSSWMNTNRFGNFRVDENGIELGGRIKLTKDSVRVGDIIMDHHGIRRQSERGGPSGVQTWFRGLGAGAGPGQHYPPPEQGDESNRGANYRGPTGWDERGRRAHSPGHVARMRSESVGSVSSLSSVSSVESCDSDSSIGSLPDYDNISASQLPLYTSRLQDWTSHPEKIRTKADVRQFKEDLRAAKQQPPPGPPPQLQQQQQPGSDRGLPGGFPFGGVGSGFSKAEIKALSKQWKQVKKQQKRSRQSMKRELKQQKRAEKQERRERKRELKRARKELKRGQKRVERAVHRRGGFGGGGGGGGMRGHGHHGHHGHHGGFGPMGPPQGFGHHHQHGPAHGFQGRFSGPARFDHYGPGGHGPFGHQGPMHHGPFGNDRNRGFGNVPSYPPIGGPVGPDPSTLPPNLPSLPPQTDGVTRAAPGAWPEDSKEHPPSAEQEIIVPDPNVPGPSPATAAKYRAAAQKEEEMARKLAELGQQDGDDHNDDPAKAKEIEALAEALEGLLMEADEAYAIELASSEGGF